VKDQLAGIRLAQPGGYLTAKPPLVLGLLAQLLLEQAAGQFALFLASLPCRLVRARLERSVQSYREHLDAVPRSILAHV
jgi:hypothetical protein